MSNINNEVNAEEIINTLEEVKENTEINFAESVVSHKKNNLKYGLVGFGVVAISAMIFLGSKHFAKKKGENDTESEDEVIDISEVEFIKKDTEE